VASYYNDQSEYQVPGLFYWQDPDTGELVAVDAGGNPLASPPVLQEVPAEVLPDFPWINAYTNQWVSGQQYGTIVVDQWGHVIRPLYPPGDFGLGEDGSPTDGSPGSYDVSLWGWPPFEWPPGSMHHPPEWSQDSSGPWEPPALKYWEDPASGKLVAVGVDGAPMVSPPALYKLPDGSVVDQWGNQVGSLWPPGDLGVDATGAPTGAATMPEGFQPPALKYWEDPASGKLVAVGVDGAPMVSPPALYKLPDGSVVDQWGNQVGSLWPPGDLGVDATGAPTGAATVPEGFQPPEMYYWIDPATGELVAVDESGQALTTPPGLIKLSPEQRDAMGFPPGEVEIVVDQWGNVVIPLHPPGSFGFDEETGQWHAEEPGEWPPDEWPPGIGGDSEPAEGPPEMMAEEGAGPDELVGGSEVGEGVAVTPTHEGTSGEPAEAPAGVPAPGEAAGAEEGAEPLGVAASVVGLDAGALDALVERPAAMEVGAPGEEIEAIPITVPIPRPDAGSAEVLTGDAGEAPPIQEVEAAPGRGSLGLPAPGARGVPIEPVAAELEAPVEPTAELAVVEGSLPDAGRLGDEPLEDGQPDEDEFDGDDDPLER
jgi:hypothetical protein